MSQNEEKNALKRYFCAQCGRIPLDAHEVFQGCKCGHRLFRIITKDSSPTHKNVFQSKTINKSELDFLTIREHEVGVYSINIKDILNKKAEKSDIPYVVGNEGIYSIHIYQKKKK